MGLGAQKRRTKLSADPNNTAWSRSTTSYGHRILSSQGWSPGSYLGAEDAPHSEHYTAANASHIRVLLREDNLGLGAQVGGNAETFGLSLFSGVLGRLNGKSEVELEDEREREREWEGRRRYGAMGFVSGGWLVGSEVVPSIKKVEERGSDGRDDGKTKKRKIPDEEDGANAAVVTAKKQKKRKTEVEQLAAANVEKDAERAKRKEKKQKRKKADQKQLGTDESNSAKNTTNDKAVRKQEKRARKEERRKRKEERRLRNEAKALRKSKSDEAPEASEVPPEPSPVQRQAAPASMGNRQAVRQRYIQQKRMASMDPRAMQEIFMVKAAG
ncbi:telomerase inhibitor [Saxophila tyrrhenica]|uniref:PinX1-related protein 1 n=1 Tax=Saxophila tyrrhenica TaxID=1690608 RepID=A0AAV9PIR0_9PEZI|nr:telomerase inhibitor [Saxophila tyrrhenica]